MKKLIIAAFLIVFLCAGQAVQAQSLGDDLCPSPNVASKQTPNDLASVQSDIERFALCLKRAELLEQLNELSAKNTDSLLGINSPSSMPAMPNDAALAALPPISANDLGLDDMSEDYSRDKNADVEIAEDTRTPWLINDIYGIHNNLRARITSKDGEIANVRNGDALSDGYTVKSISRSGVTLGGKGKVDLQWAR
ncbi:MAG: hypothetical protein CMH30_09000 [Micavibrio sp.]|nr:hypothetical protein [Micavibrio sp.]|tara:strand:+ start:295 stop:879 length:585 start_codon:yes stop_codon:yes gene_type:complete